jgi:NADH-quinone oxidoreductase subunit L
MALIALVQYDIKRVVAYSTLSQLGYMTVALGASAYPAAIFHLMTHAFFKAALFLGAGSVIIAMHHEQDMRHMGGLRRYMPITYLVVVIGSLANAGFVGFAGFFSKESIIEAARLATTPGAGFAYVLALATVFVTAFYSFRLVFYAFHGKERFDVHGGGHAHAEAHDDHDHHGPPHESPLVVTIPLVLLAIPSIGAGWLIGTVLFGGFFADSIYIAWAHKGLETMAAEYHGVVAMMLHGLLTLPFWLALGGIALAWYFYIARPDLPGRVREQFGLITRILENKYGFDDFNQRVFADGAVKVGTGLWKGGDVGVIDGVMINGSARAVGAFAGFVRRLQTGFIYQYAFTMIIGLALALAFWLAPWFGSLLGRP